jgi:hypothetical protein
MEQFSPPDQGLRGMRTPVFLAEEVGEELGFGEISLGQVSPGEVLGTTRGRCGALGWAMRQPRRAQG